MSTSRTDTRQMYYSKHSIGIAYWHAMSDDLDSILGKSVNPINLQYGHISTHHPLFHREKDAVHHDMRLGSHEPVWAREITIGVLLSPDQVIESTCSKVDAQAYRVIQPIESKDFVLCFPDTEKASFCQSIRLSEDAESLSKFICVTAPVLNRFMPPKASETIRHCVKEIIKCVEEHGRYYIACGFSEVPKKPKAEAEKCLRTAVKIYLNEATKLQGLIATELEKQFIPADKDALFKFKTDLHDIVETIKYTLDKLNLNHLLIKPTMPIAVSFWQKSLCEKLTTLASNTVETAGAYFYPRQ